jgi:F0F1-type ATP synthase assembly protein I
MTFRPARLPHCRPGPRRFRPRVREACKISTPSETRQSTVTRRSLRKKSQALPFRGYTPAEGVHVTQRETPQSTSAQVSKYVGTGMTWALSTVLFLYAGHLLDGRLGTTPWLTLIGAFVGAAAGFWYMYYHLVVEPQRQRERDRKADR